MDLNRDGFSTQKELKIILSNLDAIDGAVDGKVQNASYEMVTKKTLLKICYESAIMKMDYDKKCKLEDVVRFGDAPVRRRRCKKEKKW